MCAVSSPLSLFTKTNFPYASPEAIDVSVLLKLTRPFAVSNVKLEPKLILRVPSL